MRREPAVVLASIAVAVLLLLVIVGVLALVTVLDPVP